MQNLWGDFNIEKTNTPINILESQIDFLEKETKGLVSANLVRNIVVEKAYSSINLCYDFLLKGRDISNYSYKLFSIELPIDLYPTLITLDSATFEEIESHVDDKFKNNTGKRILIKNEEEYIAILRLILTSDRMRRLITGIISLDGVN